MPNSTPTLIAKRAKDGTLQELWAEDSEVRFDFRQNRFKGPRFFLSEENESAHAIDLSVEDGDDNLLSQHLNDIEYELLYVQTIDRSLELELSVKNCRPVALQPKQLSVMLGLDTRVLTYPEWRQRCYPTFLRCEKTHFWSHFVRPDGNGLLVCSPDPIASWHHDFRETIWDDGNHWSSGIIETTHLDLLHPGPLPPRHPDGCAQIKPGEKRVWRLRFAATAPKDSLEDVTRLAAELCEATLPYLERTTTAPDSPARVTFIGKSPIVSTLHQPPSGQTHTLSGEGDSAGMWESKISNSEIGLHSFTAIDEQGKKSECSIQVHHPWASQLAAAGRAALRYPQIASTHCEGYYGFYSAFLGMKHGLLRSQEIQRVEKDWNRILPMLFDLENCTPRTTAWRVQNQSTIIGQLVDRYEATSDLDALELAARFADRMIEQHQIGDGSFRAEDTHYTCVIYPAKSLLELITHEDRLGKNDPTWKNRSEQHRKAVKFAMDDLEVRRDNIQTEGSQFFEDGMVSCSAAQLALYALTIENRDLREHYTEAALDMLSMHNCLTQRLTPDARVRGGTHRTWEAQFDLSLQPEVISCPHGWAAWRIYGTFYAYLLTGEEHWLQETINALGACTQLIDPETDTLSWAFALNPHLQAKQVIRSGLNPRHEESELPLKGFFHPNTHPSRSLTICEEPLPMNGDWFHENTCCHDVHEIFKCLEEVLLNNAFCIIRVDGEVRAINGRVESTEQNTCRFIADSPHIHRIHLNDQRAAQSEEMKVELQFHETSQSVLTTGENLLWTHDGSALAQGHPWCQI